MSASLVICGGGTGGHVSPGLAVARELKELDINVAWLGVKGGIEERMVPSSGMQLHMIDFSAPTGGIAGYVRCVIRLGPAVMAAKQLLAGLNVKAALGLGGYPSLPGMIAARWLGCRCLLHEQNARPGLANRVLAPWMHRLLTSNPQAFAHLDPSVTGNPVRPGFAGIEEPAARFARRGQSLRLLVIGGSQGARSLNNGVPAALAKAKSKWEVAHSCGRGNADAVQAAYAKAGVQAEVIEFIDNMPERLADADLVVCRAGASTVSELACVGVAAVLVPYPHARQHQDANAETLCAAGAAFKLADAQLAQPSTLAETLDKLADRDQLLRMSELALAQGRPQAARDVAIACQEELQHAA